MTPPSQKSAGRTPSLAPFSRPPPSTAPSKSGNKPLPPTSTGPKPTAREAARHPRARGGRSARCSSTPGAPCAPSSSPLRTLGSSWYVAPLILAFYHSRDNRDRPEWPGDDLIRQPPARIRMPRAALTLLLVAPRGSRHPQPPRRLARIEIRREYPDDGDPNAVRGRSARRELGLARRARAAAASSAGAAPRTAGAWDARGGRRLVYLVVQG